MTGLKNDMLIYTTGGVAGRQLIALVRLPGRNMRAVARLSNCRE